MINKFFTSKLQSSATSFFSKVNYVSLNSHIIPKYFRYVYFPKYSKIPLFAHIIIIRKPLFTSQLPVPPETSATQPCSALQAVKC